MAKILRNKNKELNEKRLLAIESYELSLFTLVNPNTVSMLKMNPIGGKLALDTLKELQEELENIVIDIKEIDCDRFFNGITDLTETEKYLGSIYNGLAIRKYNSDYKSMIEEKELSKSFPREERQAVVNQLEEKIKKELMKASTIGKLSKEIKTTSEEKVKELRKELNYIMVTLEPPTKDYINNMLFNLVVIKIKEISSRIEYKINYLEGVLN